MAPALHFQLLERCPHSAARVGALDTPHGRVQTPLFMPVGTRASVKGLDPAQLAEVGTQVVLANAYHLHLRPGEEVIRELGGLHDCMGWSGPILTDSGGYQVFSMADIARVDESGVRFRSVVDGSKVELTPERAVDVQRALGADIAMAFDHCPSNPLEREQVELATARTGRWLERCVTRWRSAGGHESEQALFGIVQGGAFADLRQRSVEEVVAHDLPGYAIGGVSVGEQRDAMWTAVEACAPLLPEDKPRYLMGVGTPLDLVQAITHGVDMFDCVTPTRHGRNHQVWTSAGRMNLRNKRWMRDDSPLDPDCDCSTCARFSRGYLRHLCTVGEMLAGSALSVHNLRFFHRLLEEARAAIPAGAMPALLARVAELETRRP